MRIRLTNRHKRFSFRCAIGDTGRKADTMNMQEEARLEFRKHGSMFQDGKKRITAMVESGMNDAELAKALADEYGIGGHSHMYSDGTGGFVDYDGKGIRFTVGRLTNPSGSTIAPWKTVAKMIREMVERGEYLDERERGEYEAWKRDAKNVAYMAGRFGVTVKTPDEPAEPAEPKEAPLGQMNLFELFNV